MRYLTIIVSLTLLSANALTGQSRAYSSGKLYAGFIAGINATAIFFQNNYGQTDMDYVIPAGFAGGGTLHYRFSSKSHLVVEASYQVMGQKHDDRFKNMDFYKDINLSYVAFPVLYKFILNKKRIGYEAGAHAAKPRLYLMAGFQPSFLLKANVRHEVDGNQTDFISFITEGGNPNIDQILVNGQPEDDEELYNDFDIMFIGAAGFHTNIQPNVIGFLEARGGIGLLDLNAEIWQLPGPNGTYNWSRNLSIGIHAGILFRIF